VRSIAAGNGVENMLYMQSDLHIRRPLHVSQSLKR
jgi:hypothetical protein